MNDKMDEFNNFPRWLQNMVPLVSVILSILAFSYVMYLYNQEALEFVQWVRLIIFTIMSVVFILSAIFYIFNRKLAWKWLVGGLGLLPILLLLQFIIFLMTAIRMAIDSIFQGSLPEPIQMFIENYPSKFDIIILAVLFVIGLLWIINKLSTKKD